MKNTNNKNENPVDEILEESISMTYGIAPLDKCLGGYLEPGNIHLVGGYTGSGKTVLACQLLVRNLERGKRILYLSTEVDEKDVQVRCVSNAARIDYGTGDIEFEYNDNVPYMPKLERYTDDQCSRGLQVLQNFVHKARFCKIDTAHEGLTVAAIDTALSGCGAPPDLVIVDYMSWSGDPENPTRHREEMIEVMEYLQGLANGDGLNVVVFAQGTDLCKTNVVVPVNATCECKTLHRYADATLMMSWLDVPDLGEAESGGLTEENTILREQYLNVQAQGVNVVVPVKTDYQYMTLEAGSHKVDKRGRDHIAAARDRDKARSIVQAPGMNQYRWLGHSVYERVQEIGYPPAVNVYIFHLLAANQSGVSWHSFKGMAKQMGLSVEQVRTAIDKLVNAKLLERVVVKKKAMKRRVVKLDENSAFGDDKGASKLNQNMLRTDFKLLSSPSRFRFWVHLLLSAHSNFDLESSRPGEVVLSFYKLDEKLGITRDEITSALQAFKLDERISISGGSLRGNGVVRLRLINWMVYQFDVPRALSEGRGRKKATRISGVMVT